MVVVVPKLKKEQSFKPSPTIQRKNNNNNMPRVRKEAHRAHVPTRVCAFRDWKNTKRMVDEGAKAFWEKRGLSAPPSFAVFDFRNPTKKKNP